MKENVFIRVCSDKNKREFKIDILKPWIGKYGNQFKIKVDRTLFKYMVEWYNNPKYKNIIVTYKDYNEKYILYDCRIASYSKYGSLVQIKHDRKSMKKL